MSAADLDVVVVGAIGVDTCVYLYGAEIDFEVESNFSQNLDYVGQAGGFSSRGFAQLGYNTGFVGFTGADHNGAFVAEALAADGIAALLFADPMGTRRSVNFMYRDGRRKNFYDGKGNMAVRPDMEACRALLSRARLAHFSIENWTRYLLQQAKELGLLLSCDLQDVVSLDDEYRRDFIAYADIIFASGANFADPADLIEPLLATKPDCIVVVGLGSRGCALGSSAGIKMFAPLAIDLPVVDTNGAGDGLAVGFLSGYCLEGLSLEDAVLRGQLVARYSCSLKATSSELITKSQLDSYFRWFKS